MSEPVLEVREVSKAFAQVQAVAAVSLDVHAGEVFGLLGPNGAGKTTLIRMILDIYRPDSGAVSVFGHHLRREDLDSIGYLPEERGLYRRRKVIQILSYLGRLKGLTARGAVSAAEGWLERLDIPQYRDSRLETLSKGNQQKIQLIGTLIASPRLLVWDEPFSGLDPVNVARVRDLIRERRKAGATVILSTHLMDQAEALCDRVALVDHGRRVLYGTVDAVRDAHGGAEIDLETDADVTASGDWPEVLAVDSVQELAGSGLRRLCLRLNEDAPPEALLRRLLDRGSRIAAFQPRRPTLEEVFLRAVA